jgi:hypothetical protein
MFSLSGEVMSGLKGAAQELLLSFYTPIRPPGVNLPLNRYRSSMGEVDFQGLFFSLQYLTTEFPDKSRKAFFFFSIF